MILSIKSYWLIGIVIPTVAVALILIGFSSISSEQTKALELRGQILKSQYHSMLEKQAFQMRFTADDEVSYNCWKFTDRYDPTLWDATMYPNGTTHIHYGALTSKTYGECK